MAVIVKEAKSISDLEVIYLVSHFTEEFFKSETWTRGAIKTLYKRYDEIMKGGYKKCLTGKN